MAHAIRAANKDASVAQISPPQMPGSLVLAGTRIPVTVILDNLAEGATNDQILGSSLSPRRAHINAALARAAELA